MEYKLEDNTYNRNQHKILIKYFADYDKLPKEAKDKVSKSYEYRRYQLTPIWVDEEGKVIETKKVVAPKKKVNKRVKKLNK